MWLIADHGRKTIDGISPSGTHKATIAALKHFSTRTFNTMSWGASCVRTCVLVCLGRSADSPVADLEQAILQHVGLAC